MKFIIWVVILACSIAIPAGAQKSPTVPSQTLPSPSQPPAAIPNYPSARERPLAIKADKMTIVGKTIQYRGHLRMTTESVIVTADELDYDSSTQSAKATGNVAIQVRPPGPIVVPLSQ